MNEKLFTILCSDAERQKYSRYTYSSITEREASTLTEEEVLHLLLLKAKIEIVLGDNKWTILEEHFRHLVIKYKLLFEQGDYRD